MKILTVIARIILGLAFVVFGLNFILNFLPQPPPPAGLAGDYFKIFVSSHLSYSLLAKKFLNGLLLFFCRFLALCFYILSGVFFFFLAFHILMDPQGIGPGIIATLLWALLFWQYRDRFAGILRP